MPHLPPTPEEREVIENRCSFNSTFRVNTTFNDKEIRQAFVPPQHDLGISGLVERVLHLQDKATQQALVKLGYLPPEVTKKLQSEVLALTQNDGGSIQRLLDVLKAELFPTPEPKRSPTGRTMSSIPEGLRSGRSNIPPVVKAPVSGFKRGGYVYPQGKPAGPPNTELPKTTLSNKLRKIIRREED